MQAYEVLGFRVREWVAQGCRPIRCWGLGFRVREWGGAGGRMAGL